MNLLLLLSALLSALTGIGGQVRAPDVAQAISGTAKVATVAVSRPASVAMRPVQALPSLTFIAVVATAALLLPLGEPRWASRRRE